MLPYRASASLANLRCCSFVAFSFGLRMLTGAAIALLRNSPAAPGIGRNEAPAVACCSCSRLLRSVKELVKNSEGDNGLPIYEINL